MRKLLSVFIFCCTVIILSSQTYDLAIQDVSIYDPKSRSITSDKTILIKGNRIASIIDLGVSFASKKTIEGRGRLITPGFIDTHVHINQMYAIGNGVSPETIDENDIKLMQRMLALQHLQYGTTTIVDMGHPEEWIEQTLAWQNNPVSSSPNIFINGSSTISDEERVPAQHHHEVMNPEDAREKVRRYAKLGLQYMKLYSRLRKPEMEAIAAEARKHSIILNAHVDYGTVTIQEAMDMGVKNFEHFFTVLPCVIDYNEHWGLMKRKYGITSDGIDGFSAMMSFFFMYLDELQGKKEEMEALFDLMASEGASISTTIHVLGAAAGRTESFTSFNHFPIRQSPNLVNYSPENEERLKNAHVTLMTYLKNAYDRGVKVRIGTDCRYGGRSLMSEIDLLAKAGFTSQEILEIATINGYEAMGLDKERGLVAEGMIADLILFTENPIEDPSHFAGEKVVIKDGVVADVKRSLAYEMLDKITFGSLEEGLSFYEKYKDSEAFEYNPMALRKVGYDLIGTGLIDEALTVLRLANPSFKTADLELKEAVLNNAGYAFLSKDLDNEAIRCFFLNSELFPESWNVWDSLGEGHLSNGDEELALRYYEKSVQLNPENENGKKILLELRAK